MRTSALLLALVVGCSSTSVGSGGEVIAVDFKKPVEPSKAARSAAFVASCIPDDSAHEWLQHAYYEIRDDAVDNGIARGALDCLAARADGCAAVRDCLGITVDTTGPCEGKCTGSIAEGCDDSLRFRIDCARFGDTCDPERGRCASPTPREACDAMSYKPNCGSGRPTNCSGDHVIRGQVCADYGLDCGTSGGMPDVMCHGTGAACSATSFHLTGITYDQGLRCEAGKLVTCLNGREQTVDCGSLGVGFSCQTASGRAFCGAANECNPIDAVDPICEGTALVVCNAGKREKVDCKSLGFTGCNARYGVCTTAVYPD